MKIYLIAKPTSHPGHGGSYTSWDIPVANNRGDTHKVQIYYSIKEAHIACTHGDRIVELEVQCTPT